MYLYLSESRRLAVPMPGLHGASRGISDVRKYAGKKRFWYNKKLDSPSFWQNMSSIDCIFHIIYAFYRRHNTHENTSMTLIHLLKKSKRFG